MEYIMSNAKSSPKRKSVTATTPLGKAQWFNLNKADQFGNYTCTIHLEENPETLKLISLIDSIGAGKKPYEKQADGSFKLKMKSKSKGTKKSGEQYVVNPPVIYDSLGKKLTNMEVTKLNVGNGSEIRAILEFSTYAMLDQETQEVVKGISSKVKAVQLGKVVEFEGNADLGFGALEIDSSEDKEESSSENYDF